MRATRGASSVSRDSGWLPPAAPLGLVTLVIFLLAASKQGAAYVITSGGFADGLDSAVVSFAAGPSEQAGPAIHLLTNATVVQGNLAIRADPVVTNVSLRWDSVTAPFYSFSGNLSAGAFVAMDVGPLNAAIESARSLPTVPASINVTVFVSAEGPGDVTLSQPRIDLQLANPLNVTYDPAPGAVVAQEGKYLRLSYLVWYVAPDLPANSSWFLDGRPSAESHGDPRNFDVYFDYFSAGNHTVEVLIWRGAERANATWTVVVADTNVPPDEGLIHYSKPLSVSRCGSITIQSTAYDEGGDLLTLKWLLDGAVIAGNVTNVTLTNLPVGWHTLEVNVTDGVYFRSSFPRIVSESSGPVIYQPTPRVHDFGVIVGTPTPFDAWADDHCEEQISYAWFVDDAPVATGFHVVFNESELPIGRHTVRVVVTAGNYSTEWNWTVGVEALPPGPVVAEPSPSGALGVPWIVWGAIAVASVVASVTSAAIVFLWRRRQP